MAASAPGGAPRPAFYNDPRVRSIAYQVLALLLVGGVGYYLVSNTIENLNRLGVATGFAFLQRPAGFGISQTPIPYNETQSFGRAFLVGLANTAWVAVVGIFLATVIGFVVGIARLSRNWLVARLATGYVELIRNIPVLLQLLFAYKVVLASLPSPQESLNLFGLLVLNNRGMFAVRPVLGEGAGLLLTSIGVALVAAILFWRWAMRRRELTGHALPVLPLSLAILIVPPLLVILITGGAALTFELPETGRFRTRGGITLLPEFVAIVLGLSIYTASYIAEIVRAGILSVSKGQTEAASALGLSHGQTLRLIVVPQALRVITPPLASQYLNLTKNSSLGVAVGYPDFFSIAGTVNNQTGQAVEVIAVTMAVYLVLSLLTSAFMNWYNARIALVER
jgi:general L-amino acid transport system permease protein